MEIEVGEYYRTKSGYIDKIRSIDKQGNIFKDEKGKLQLWLGETAFGDPYCEEIVKHSKNIIDLIQIGDYVNGKKVLRINDYGDFKRADFNLDYDDEDAVYNEDIKTILTKEQYEQNSYKI